MAARGARAAIGDASDRVLESRVAGVRTGKDLRKVAGRGQCPWHKPAYLGIVFSRSFHPEGFKREPSYERRVVVFYDFLGWQNHIDLAGKDPKALGFLRRMLLRHPRMLGVKEDLEIRYSTFSDNVVITQKVGPTTKMLIQQLANFQLGAALPGFLLRGGITIGDVVHDDEVVFGPGLNRAYHLESIVAKLPRLVLDPLVG
jgi:hypothetical protein